MNTITVATPDAQKGFYSAPLSTAEDPIEGIVFVKPHTSKALREVAA